jgi:putative alpha-1,2-mannosidase
MTRQPAILSAVLLLACVPALAADGLPKPSVDYVSPNIGNMGQLLSATLPYVQVPYGMARLIPVTTSGIQDCYLADKIFGFTPGAGTLMISTGEASPDRAAYASNFDHDFETATPYYYAVDLPTLSSKAEYTATQHAGFYRFTFPASSSADISFSIEKGGELAVVGPNALEGSQLITGTVATAIDLSKETRLYFYAEFSRPFGSYQTWQNHTLQTDGGARGDGIGFVSTQSTRASGNRSKCVSDFPTSAPTRPSATCFLMSETRTSNPSKRRRVLNGRRLSVTSKRPAEPNASERSFIRRFGGHSAA